jgi:lipopolysaccharide transport system ATP-binding protein
MAHGVPIFPKIKILTRGNIAFNAMDTSDRWHDASPPGEYVSTAWIPGNLLNEGLTTAEVAICSIAAPKLYPHAAAYEAVAFNVQDPAEGDSARGQFGGQWRGVVRPLLDWTTEER